MIQFNQHLINPNNICSAKRYYQITKIPGDPDKKDYFRIWITYVGGIKEDIQFDTAEQMDDAFETLKQYK